MNLWNSDFFCNVYVFCSLFVGEWIDNGFCNCMVGFLDSWGEIRLIFIVGINWLFEFYSVGVWEVDNGDDVVRNELKELEEKVWREF